VPFKETNLIYFYFFVSKSLENAAVKVKVKDSRNRPGVAQRGSRRFRLPDFHDIRHVKVLRLSVSCTGCLYPQDIFLILMRIKLSTWLWLEIRMQDAITI
jgi:hypothetical protein